MSAYIDRQRSSRIIKSQATAITSGTVSQASTTFGPQTYQIRVTSTLGAWLRYGDGAQTAVAGDTYIPPNVVEYFTVTPGQQAAFISTSTSSGMFSLTEMG